MRRRSFIPYLVLLGGVLVASSASIMIRGAQRLGMPSPVIAAGRLGLAALILLPIALRYATPEMRRLRPRDLLLGISSGALLALHFISWISSLEYTSVASSAALVATNPLWVGLGSLLLFRERLMPLTLLGLLLTIGGSVLIGLSDGLDAGGTARNALLGDGLALLGALAGSGYFLIGRELRRRLSILAYIWLVYTSAAAILLVVALAASASLNTTTEGSGRALHALISYPPAAYALLLGLAIGPQLLGHTSFNWALRDLSATFVAVATLGEPIGSALLALLIFQEGFALAQLAGLVLLLAGIFVAARGENRQTTETSGAEYRGSASDSRILQHPAPDAKRDA